jgi:hypothetical protein
MRDKSEYLALFDGAHLEKRIGEASVWYLYSGKAASEIKTFCPRASIIIMLRNPVDVLHAQHSQFLYNGNEEIEDFEEALRAESDRKQGRRIPRGAHFVEGLFYRETVLFSQQVGRFQEHFGRQDIHFIIYDDLKEDPSGVYRETLKFLGVEVGHLPDFRAVNPNKRVRSRLLLGLLQNSVPLVRATMGRFLPRETQHGLYKRIRNLNTRWEDRQPMDPQLRRRLQEDFASEIQRLGHLVGRDLSHWADV